KALVHLIILPTSAEMPIIKQCKMFSPPDRPNLPSVSVSPSEIVEGSSVTLTCSSDANPAANYTWYKSDTHLKSIHEEPQFVFRSIKSSDSGQYYCEAGNKLGTSRSESVSIDVKCELNKTKLNIFNASNDTLYKIYEPGSSVTLTCSSDANPAANYTWYKENEESPKASGQIFTITDIRAEHSGNYYCEVQNSVGQDVRLVFRGRGPSGLGLRATD
uniref:Ig-like domain-containing protein n=1 Tax=Anabas testudineus TaxID=64144 RepID=A0AAQ6IF07_ANATE